MIRNDPRSVSNRAATAGERARLDQVASGVCHCFKQCRAEAWPLKRVAWPRPLTAMLGAAVAIGVFAVAIPVRAGEQMMATSSPASPTSAPAAPTSAPVPPPAPVFAAGSPELHDITPAGMTRGTTCALTLRGARLSDAAELLFYKPGITVAELKPGENNTIVATCAVAPDCPLGEHPLRLRTAGGVTELRTVWIGALPVAAEVEPNGDFGAPQKIALNSTIEGVVTLEDVDYFAVEAKKGQRLTAEIEAMRLGRAMFDPAVAILDSRRFEQAVSDDSALLLQDSVASIVVPAEGVYVISVRDASLGGGDQARYRLHVGTFPRPRVAYPPVGRPGEGPVAALLGDAAGPMRQALGVMPSDAADAWPVYAADDTGMSPSPVWMRPGPYPARGEPLPGNPPSAPTSAPAEPAVPSAPCAVYGVIAVPGEVDRHRFLATKGQALVIESYARRLRSPLDCIVEVFDAGGQGLAGADDGAGVDSVLNWSAPADGEYELRVRDHLGRGGDTFVYVVEVAPPRPNLALSLERVDAKRPQHLQAIAVPRGNRFAVLVRADRQNIGGAATLEFGNIPSGLSVHESGIESDRGVTPVVFEAAADAPLAGSLVDVRGRIKPGEGLADLVGAFRQTIPLIIAAPNETVYYQTHVDRLAVAVTQPAPYRVDVEPPKSPLAQNGTKALKVRVTREPGFTGDVTLQMLWNPPGIASAVSIPVTAAATDALYPISAAPDAPIRTSNLVILARAAVAGGDVWVSSALTPLQVERPFVNGTIQLAAAQRGQTASLHVKLEPVRPFEGTATLTMLGLPPHATCSPKPITAADKEIVFDAAIGPEAPIGQHGGLLCQLSIVQNGEEIAHRVAQGGVLRIDAPPPAPAVAAAPTPPPPPAAAPAAKPLSRLEQLRKQAAEKAAAASNPPAAGEASGGMAKGATP